jgi:hypothetical protein
LELREAGVPVGGLLTHELREGGERRGGVIVIDELGRMGASGGGDGPAGREASVRVRRQPAPSGHQSIYLP